MKDRLFQESNFRRAVATAEHRTGAVGPRSNLVKDGQNSCSHV